MIIENKRTGARFEVLDGTNYPQGDYQVVRTGNAVNKTATERVKPVEPVEKVAEAPKKAKKATTTKKSAKKSTKKTAKKEK